MKPNTNQRAPFCFVGIPTKQEALNMKPMRFVRFALAPKWTKSTPRRGRFGDVLVPFGAYVGYLWPNGLASVTGTAYTGELLADR